MSMSKKNKAYIFIRMGYCKLWHKDAASNYTVVFDVLKVESKGVILE